jgi:hypothetical protein
VLELLETIGNSGSQLYEAQSWEVHLCAEFSFLLEFLVLDKSFLLFYINFENFVPNFHRFDGNYPSDMEILVLTRIITR